MKIGEIAHRTGVSKSIIRYYEGKGVLPRAVRDAAGYRDYGEAELARIRFVTGARRLGCSFPQIKAMIAMREGDDCTPSDVVDLLTHKLAEVDAEVERLEKIRSELLRLHELGMVLTKAERQVQF